MDHQNPGLAWAVVPPGTQKRPVQTQMVPCPRPSRLGYLIASAAHFHAAGVNHPGLLLASDKEEKSPKMGFGGTGRLPDAIRAAGGLGQAGIHPTAGHFGGALFGVRTPTSRHAAMLGCVGMGIFAFPKVCAGEETRESLPRA